MVGAMTFSKFGLTTFAFAALVTVPGSAGDLTEVFHSCVAKFARSTQDATVTLECTAAEGKVSGCKVVNAPIPSNGFDKAALCVADSLPIGSKTGPISFPIKFEKNHF
jgi:hypothetical protein